MKNKLYKTPVIFLLLLSVGNGALAQISGFIPGEELTFENYFNRVGKNNLAYIAEKLNMDIADAEVVAQKIFPDPELEFEAADEYYNLGLAYSLELGNKRGARVRLARSIADFERLSMEYYFQELRAEAADIFLEAILQRELLNVKIDSYNYMRQLSHSDSLRFIAGEINENDARQSKLEAITLLNEIYDQEASYKSALAVLNQYMGSTADTLNIPVGSWDNLKMDYQLPELIKMGLENRIDLIASQKKH